MVKLAGAFATVLFAGLVMLTEGAAFEMTLIALEVVMPLWLSVALAVSE